VDHPTVGEITVSAAASNKAMHVWAEIIQGIKETEKMLDLGASRRRVKDHRAYRSMLLRQRLGKMAVSGWSVEGDELAMYGSDAKTYIYKSGKSLWITEEFSFTKAMEMYESSIDVGIFEIKEACQPRMVP
jgi:hypothetical protein